MTSDCCVFKFLQCSVDGKHLMRFQSETTVFKFLRRNVDEARVNAINTLNKAINKKKLTIYLMRPY